jgi:TetR/AcrR family transcriptional repressor of nem operon
MPRDGRATRERLLEAAHGLVMEQGFAGTTVDAVLAEAGATKGAFFHHFPSKDDLGRALLDRYARADAEHLERTMERVERLSGDPLQRLLLFVALLEEETDAESAGEPGCLFASFLYERQLVDEATRRLIADSMRLWRDRLSATIRAAAEAHPPVREIDADALADQLLTVVEGAFVLSRALDDPGVVSRQLRQYRDHLELLFLR